MMRSGTTQTAPPVASAQRRSVDQIERQYVPKMQKAAAAIAGAAAKRSSASVSGVRTRDG